jgi:hypothetical protein
MNIFYLDEDVKKCAEYHCDKHCIKMILETAQLLASAHWVSGSSAPYKLTHKNHPSAVWTRQSLSNYRWLCQLGLALCKEYTHRYEKIHKTQEVITWLINNLPDIEDIGFIEPPKAMADSYKLETAVASYRNYYQIAKSRFATWKRRPIPDWFNQQV